jgi:hypothetical protein
MECLRIRPLMIEAVLGAANDVERQSLVSHCAQCVACASAYRRCLDTVAGVRAQAETPAVPQELRTRLLAAVHHELGHRPLVAWQPRFAMAGGLAALALLAFAVTFFVHRPAGLHGGDVWTYVHGRALQATSLHAPVVCDDRLFALSGADSNAGVVAFDRRSGKTLWQCAIASYGYLAAADGRVLCVTPGKAGGSGLAAIDAASGTLLWRYESGSDRGRAPGIPVAWNGRVLWNSGATLHQLDGASGVCRWSRPLAVTAPNSQVALCGARGHARMPRRRLRCPALAGPAAGEHSRLHSAAARRGGRAAVRGRAAHRRQQLGRLPGYRGRNRALEEKHSRGVPSGG